jgi:hypothetical protein
LQANLKEEEISSTKDPKEEAMLTTSSTLNFALAITALFVLFNGMFPSFLLNLVKASILG